MRVATTYVDSGWVTRFHEVPRFQRSGAEGCRFEPCRAHQLTNNLAGWTLARWRRAAVFPTALTEHRQLSTNSIDYRVFDYLVTSRARRQLLRRLWADGASGSVSALARATGVSFAAAHRELEAMKAAGLTVAERDGVATVYRANLAHPQADALTALLTAAPPAGASEEQRLRGRLAALGAPLGGPAPTSRRPPPEEVLADGLVLAHHSPTVARVLPVAFWRQRDNLDYERLEGAATLLDERHTLGFYLELTGRLGGDRRLVRRASGLRDRRRTALRPFFSDGRGAFARAAAEERSPALARRWGFLMNMELESFATAFGKHVSVAP